MKRKTRWGLFFGLVLPVFLLLVGLLVFLSTMKGSAPFVFMNGARQDGYWAPTIDGSAQVSRFYVIDRPVSSVLEEATLELSEANGWQKVGHVTTEEVTFTNGPRWVLISRFGDKTSVVVSGHANKSEELIGTVYESFPERFESWR